MLSTEHHELLQTIEKIMDEKLKTRTAQSEPSVLEELERLHMQVWDNTKKLDQLQADIRTILSGEHDFAIIYSYLNRLDNRISRLESASSSI